MSKALLSSFVVSFLGLFILATGFLVAFSKNATGEVWMTITIHLLVIGFVVSMAGFLFMIVLAWNNAEIMDQIDALFLRALGTINKGVEVSKEWLKKTIHVAKVVAIDGFTKKPVATGLSMVITGAIFIVAAILAENRDFAVSTAAIVGVVLALLGTLIVLAHYCQNKNDESSA
ncbi:MAG: hypothetical protein HGB08_01025 [Candidatus Moranbacteria bacterium]|nr:hypothetical protein [Candidatus Moranbacteria bacterium]